MRRLSALLFAALLLGCARTAPGSPAAAPSFAPPSPRSEIRLDLVVSADLSAVEGSMSLRWVNAEAAPADRIRFLLFPLLAGAGMEITACTVDGRASALSPGPVAALPLPQAVASGRAVDVALSWRATVPRLEDGGAFARSDGFASLAWCFPVPVSPRTGSDFPAPYADWLCTDAMSWRARVSIPAGATLVAAGTETGRAGVDGRTVVDLALDPARDFYLAVGTGLAERPPRRAGGGPAIRCFAPPGREGAADVAMDAAARAVQSFTRRFGPYPYGSFAILAGPLAVLGIEFPGLTVIGDAVFTLSGTVSGVPARTMLEATVVHEVAHQWFYNLVGSDQAAEPWLDEAMAQYATRLYYLDRYGEDGADGIVDSWWARWNRVDRAMTPAGLPVAAYGAKEYAAIVYGRGPLFLETLETSMGTRAFDAFLRAYTERFAWRIARRADVLAAAEESCRCDLDALFAAWLGSP